MFDARRLLDQVMGAIPPEVRTQAVQATGGRGDLLTGAVAGGLAGGVLGLLAGNKRARKFAGNAAGTALKLGGLAAVAAIGYTAWQRHRSGAPGSDLLAPPAGSGFSTDSAPQGSDQLARAMMVAMIQGAKADGHIDAGEQARIFAHVEALGLDAAAKAFVFDELAAPADVQRIAAHATTPEIAAELYAATLLAMDPDTAEERAFLSRLEGALRLEPGLARQIEDTVRAQADG
jgi:uncharacterized membrane protein YebE (DUF533 family)